MGFWPKRKEDKLYKQWAEHNGLPIEAAPRKETISKKETIPQKEITEETPARVGEGGRRIVILYILLAAAVVLLCVGIIILLVQG